MPELGDRPTLKDLQDYVVQMKLERGFRTDDTIYECFLLGEELGELFKAVRKAEGSGRIANDSTAGEVGEELADCLIYLCSIANQMDVDLEQAFRAKEDKNKRRSWPRTNAAAASAKHREMTAQMVHWYQRLFEELNIEIWLDGGWGVDALLGRQTRPHKDLDIIASSAAAQTLDQALRQRGFHDVATDDHTPRNYVLGHIEYGLIDFHVAEPADQGGLIYGPGQIDWRISPQELGGRGTIAGVPVQCLSAEYQVRSHAGYKLKDTDRADLRALHEKFGLPLSADQVDSRP
ncbi:MAG: hypothetical protein GKR89_02060 [Candidatus Latescibacteria bacterium]|nr:hypothetical protein [Candidatus Latescibacterota bacterium]